MGEDNNQPQTLPVIQEENKKPATNNPTGIGGFKDHPELINKNGRPPKGWAWSELLEDIGDEVEPKSGKQFKELVGRRLWLECVNGNIMAVKELFNRMEGLPRLKLEVDGKIDMKIPQLVEALDKIIAAKESDANDNVTPGEVTGDQKDS